MCFSATVSFSTAAVLASTGVYAVQQARQLPSPHWKMWAMVPVLFSIQQGFEGVVWRQLDAGNAGAAIPYALGFHFFSLFLWLWWFPLCSYLVETETGRKRVIGGFTLFGALSGMLVYGTLLPHPEWMSVAVMQHSIVYTLSVPYRDSFHLPVTPAALYALIILAPLFISSHRLVRIFGVLTALSAVLASEAYGYAYVSVWCFFAAMLSLYLVYMIRRFASETSFSDAAVSGEPL